MQTIDIILIILEILLAFLLFAVAKIAIRYEDSRWRICYLLPGLAVMTCVWIGNWEVSMLPAYLAAAVMAGGFFVGKKKVRTGVSATGLGLTVLGLIVCLINPGYRMPNFVKAFEDGFSTMQAHYCLSEHKEIDWDGLYAKYLPKFQQAQAGYDRIGNVIAWMEFTDEFHDGHVNFSPDVSEKEMKEAQKRALGNDYGFSLIRLTDGRIVAANVEEGSPAWSAGIRNGSEIVTWNGRAPEAWTQEASTPIFHSADIENDAFYDILYVAGMGGDSVVVDFIDGQGEKQCVELPMLNDFYYDRLIDTLDILDQGMNIGTLTWAELSEDTVLFRIKEMSYDTVSYSNGDHAKLQREMEEKLLQYREEGKKKLIIDVRSNNGGSPQMIMAMTELFAEEGEHVCCQGALLDEKTCDFVKDENTGKYIPDGVLTYRGRNLWSQGEILLLVNGQCISAGDAFVYLMNQIENVTVMGITKSNSSGQAIRYADTECGVLIFSAIPMLDRDGEILIDTGADRISKMPLDVRVPLDENAIRMLYDEGRDYVLEYAMQWLEK